MGAGVAWPHRMLIAVPLVFTNEILKSYPIVITRCLYIVKYPKGKQESLSIESYYILLSSSKDLGTI